MNDPIPTTDVIRHWVAWGPEDDHSPLRLSQFEAWLEQVKAAAAQDPQRKRFRRIGTSVPKRAQKAPREPLGGPNQHVRTDSLPVDTGTVQYSATRHYVKISPQQFDAWLTSVKAEAWNEGRKAHAVSYDHDNEMCTEDADCDAFCGVYTNPYLSEQ